MSDVGLLLLVLIGIAIAFYVYFAPTFVAHRRGKANFLAIFWLNLLLGWTFVGWVIAFVWAYTIDEPRFQNR